MSDELSPVGRGGGGALPPVMGKPVIKPADEVQEANGSRESVTVMSGAISARYSVLQSCLRSDSAVLSQSDDLAPPGILAAQRRSESRRPNSCAVGSD